jgi:hypothetical protein
VPSEWERRAYGDIGAHELEQHRARLQDLEAMKARHIQIGTIDQSVSSLPSGGSSHSGPGVSIGKPRHATPGDRSWRSSFVTCIFVGVALYHLPEASGFINGWITGFTSDPSAAFGLAIAAMALGASVAWYFRHAIVRLFKILIASTIVAALALSMSSFVPELKPHASLVFDAVRKTFEDQMSGKIQAARTSFVRGFISARSGTQSGG